MTQSSVSNAILGALPSDEQDLVVRSCKLIPLSFGAVLTQPDEVMRSVHFVESGFVSVITAGPPGDQIEIGFVGREGLTNLSVALGCETAPFKMLVQAKGSAYEMSSERFQQLSRDVPELLRGALAYANTFTRQVADTARANARNTVESRLARWILMANDRLDGDEMPVTHETLALMLGVRRPGVTVALHVLEGEHMVKSTRGRLRVVDRDGLVAASKGAYRA